MTVVSVVTSPFYKEIKNTVLYRVLGIDRHDCHGFYERRDMKEKHLENELKKSVENLGGICWKLVSPGVAGVPDRICLKAGRVIFVELKAPGKKPRPIQNRRIKQLQGQGFQVFVIDSVDGIAEVTNALQAA